MSERINNKSDCIFVAIFDDIKLTFFFLRLFSINTRCIAGAVGMDEDLRLKCTMRIVDIIGRLFDHQGGLKNNNLTLFLFPYFFGSFCLQSKAGRFGRYRFWWEFWSQF